MQYNIALLRPSQTEAHGAAVAVAGIAVATQAAQFVNHPSISNASVELPTEAQHWLHMGPSVNTLAQKHWSSPHVNAEWLNALQGPSQLAVGEGAAVVLHNGWRRALARSASEVIMHSAQAATDEEPADPRTEQPQATSAHMSSASKKEHWAVQIAVEVGGAAGAGTCRFGSGVGAGVLAPAVSAANVQATKTIMEDGREITKGWAPIVNCNLSC